MPSPRLVLLHALGQAARARSALELELASLDLERTQTQKLRALLKRHRGTEYGRQHGFGDVRTPRAYSERVPLMTPEDLGPWVKRLMSGERNLLSDEPPVYYVRTSGSTGEPKHVPITRGYRTEFQKTVHVALWHLYFRFPEAFRGQALYFVGSRKVDVAPDGNDVGTMSGFNFTEMPPAVRRLYAWPYELFEVKHLETRNFLALALATKGDPTVVAGIFPASMVYLARDFAPMADDLGVLFAQGRLPAWLQLEPQQRAFFEQALPANRMLAERVRSAARHSEAGQLGELWPSLRLVYCWTAATAALFVPELEKRLGPQVPVRDAIYSACEGWCSIPMGEPEGGGTLAITSHFFEFIEVDAYERGSRQTKYAWELERGRQYFIVFSTSAGLHRYLLGDVVEVLGFHHGVPRIVFVRKHGAATNLAGEKLEEAHVTQAVQKAEAALGVRSAYFVAVPVFDGAVPGYRLHVEPLGAWSAEAKAAFGARVDAEIASASFDYARLRKGKALREVEVTWLAAGRYAAFRQRRVAEGAAEAQLKVANLVAGPEKLPDELR